MFMLHTLIPYWETLVRQTASTPIEYLAAMCLFALMVFGLTRSLAIPAGRTN